MNFNTPPVVTEQPNPEFQVLRERVHQQMEDDVRLRVQRDPQPTEEELCVGAFKEMIEPQVRDALFEFNRKGYPTESSGFGGEIGTIQSMDGYFEIDTETTASLEAMGVQVMKDRDMGWPGGGKRDAYSFVRFEPATPHMEIIKRQWDAIAAALPDRHIPMQPSVSGAAEEFRKEYAPERVDVEARSLQRALEMMDFEPSAERSMQERIGELKK